MEWKRFVKGKIFIDFLFIFVVVNVYNGWFIISFISAVLVLLTLSSASSSGGSSTAVATGWELVLGKGPGGVSSVGILRLLLARLYVSNASLKSLWEMSSYSGTTAGRGSVVAVIWLSSELKSAG